MAKYRIFTIGFELPGDEFESLEFDSDATLLDADIILFEPTLGNASGYESHNGKKLLNEHWSFRAQQRVEHWRSEIVAAVNAGKLVIVYLARPQEFYRHTGQKEFSGTGRSRVATNFVAGISSYDAIPNLKSVSAKSGSEIQLDGRATFLAPYWSEFSRYSPYEVEIQTDSKNILLRSRSGSRTVGAAVRSPTGTLLFLPPLRYDVNKFLREKDGEQFWTKEANQFGKRLASSLVSLASTLRSATDSTPPPVWTEDSKYRLASEDKLEVSIAECSSQIATLQGNKATLEGELAQSGSLRRLLFEQGRPLESAILDALHLFGFEAHQLQDGESEFDAVFTSPEGRCIGEAEGKDNKAINIDKFSQLERNLEEDYARDEVTEYAKGVLFGNAFRLMPVQDRGEFFTEKCRSAAKRVNVALVRTPDLFAPAKYLKENQSDDDYKKQCREAIFASDGIVVVFPHPPTDETKLIVEGHRTEVARTIHLPPARE